MPINKETEKLVLDYCKAAANLYYIIPAKKLLEIFNSQNEPLSENEFGTILEGLLSEEQYFDLFSEDEIDAGAEDNKPIIEKELLVQHLYYSGDFDDYFELKEATFGLPYHILEKEEFLKYADDFYIEKTPEFISLRAYFRNISSLSRKEADELACEAIDTLRLFNRDPEYILERMKQLKIGPKNKSEFESFTNLCSEASYKIRLASLRGATAEEAGY